MYFLLILLSDELNCLRGLDDINNKKYINCDHKQPYYYPSQIK